MPIYISRPFSAACKAELGGYKIMENVRIPKMRDSDLSGIFQTKNFAHIAFWCR